MNLSANPVLSTYVSDQQTAVSMKLNFWVVFLAFSLASTQANSLKTKGE
jgi:hypothetical protein